MIRTIISHDVDAGTARIRFEHDDVTIEADYQLINVIPSTKYVLNAMNTPFDETLQNKAIDYLEQSIQRGIEDGIITGPAEPAAAPIPEPSAGPTTDPETPAETPPAPEAE